MNARPRIVNGGASDSKTELDADRTADGIDITFCERSEPPKQTKLADRCNLIGHRFAANSIEIDVDLGRVKPLHAAR